MVLVFQQPVLNLLIELRYHEIILKIVNHPVPVFLQTVWIPFIPAVSAQIAFAVSGIADLADDQACKRILDPVRFQMFLFPFSLKFK